MSKILKNEKFLGFIYILKFLLPLGLIAICFFIKHSMAYLAFQLLELVTIILLSSAIKNKIVRRVVNTIFLLLLNIQLFVMIFGTTYVTWVMLSNLSSLEDISGHGLMYISAVAIVLLDLILPLKPIGELNREGAIQKSLSITLAIELALTMGIGAEYSPIGNVFFTARDGLEVATKSAKFAKSNVDGNDFYKDQVENQLDRPSMLPDKPNVVLIFTEGLSQNIVEDSREITPNIHKYEERSLNFTNYYNHTFATYKGLVGQLYSGYSWSDGDTNSLISMQDILKDNGYNTTFINTEPKNYQFVRYLEALGFDNLISEPNSDRSGMSDSVSDKEAYEKLWDVMENEAKTGQPFFTAIYTFGTHASFDSPDETFEDGSNQFLNKFYNADYQFGKFMDKFEKSDLADNTLIVFTTDHCTYQDADFTNTFPDYTRESWECDIIPFFIYYKGMEHFEWDAAGATSIALAPTVLDYIDMSGENYFLGTSLFGSIWTKGDFNSIFAESVNVYETSRGIEEISDADYELIGDKLEKYYIYSQQ